MKYTSLKFLKTNIGFRISIASPLTILKWSWRKINNTIITSLISEPHTINLNEGTPKINGLFCERIFGPLISWQCKCNFFNSNNPIKYISLCPLCGFENNTNVIRRYRIGYIHLNNPIVHTWYLYSFIPYILRININLLEYLIYYKFLEKEDSINKLRYIKKVYLSKLIFASNYIQFLLKQLNLLNEMLRIKSLLVGNFKKERKKYYNRSLNLINLCFTNIIQPCWVVLDILPILPAGLRPLILLDNNNFVISPLNELYKLIIIKNNRLKRLKDLRNNFSILLEVLEKRNLQKTVDKLLCFDKESKSSLSLSSHYQGKYNYFRQYILGKRIDYSGRSVIVSGSNIPFNKIGIPIILTLQLYKPILKYILKNNYLINTLLRASYFIDYTSIILKRILKYIIRKEVLIINRAPTLHRINIQTFKPLITENEVLKLYPLACAGFNADFDGDQMGIFLILSKQAKKEAKKNIIFDKNLFSLSKKKNIFKFTQNIVLGLNTLLSFKGNNIRNLFFSNIEDILSAYSHDLINLNSVLCLKFNHFTHLNKSNKKYIVTSLGRLIMQNSI